MSSLDRFATAQLLHLNGRQMESSTLRIHQETAAILIKNAAASPTLNHFRDFKELNGGRFSTVFEVASTLSLF